MSPIANKNAKELLTICNESSTKGGESLNHNFHNTKMKKTSFLNNSLKFHLLPLITVTLLISMAGAKGQTLTNIGISAPTSNLQIYFPQTSASPGPGGGAFDYTNDNPAVGEDFTSSLSFNLTDIVIAGRSDGDLVKVQLTIQNVTTGSTVYTSSFTGDTSSAGNNDYQDFGLGSSVAVVAGDEYKFNIAATDNQYYGLANNSGGGTATGASASFQTGAPSGDNLTFYTEGATVPEPSTWAMLVAGLALLGFRVRHKLS